MFFKKNACVWSECKWVWDWWPDLCTLWYSVWLQFTIHYHTHARVRAPTHTHTHSFSRFHYLLLGGPTVDVPLPQGSWTIPGISYQLLAAMAHNDWTSAVFWLTNWLSHLPTNSLLHSAQFNWLSLLNCPAYNILAWTTQKIMFLCCCLRVVA
jgi:hypothetical protein